MDAFVFHLIIVRWMLVIGCLKRDEYAHSCIQLPPPDELRRVKYVYVNDDHIWDIIGMTENGMLKVYFGQPGEVYSYYPVNGIDLASDVLDFKAAAVTGEISADIVYLTSEKLGLITVDEYGVFYDQEILLPGNGTGTVNVTDLNGDFSMDSVIGTDFGVPIVINDGTGYLYLDRILPTSDTKLVAVSDMNEDGTKDIITYSTDGHAGLWINDGIGHFSVTDEDIYIESVETIRLEDRDADECMDIVFILTNTSETVYYNDCNGRFAVEPFPTRTPTPEPTETPSPTPTEP